MGKKAYTVNPNAITGTLVLKQLDAAYLQKELVSKDKCIGSRGFLDLGTGLIWKNILRKLNPKMLKLVSILLQVVLLDN